jgi:hypothetical protein
MHHIVVHLGSLQSFLIYRSLCEVSAAPIVKLPSFSKSVINVGFDINGMEALRRFGRRKTRHQHGTGFRFDFFAGPRVITLVAP